ncbi:hypothetical protein [Adhaeretor mobilis]|uniref:Carboxypeptidase regulatory-like domain-containing protein n=1 Tax=Adhaeretor mobilis TaxID=1930276 RepID=A0A517N1A3_9BACT|nr:hypothetical protein [Adhaeretor mobilis]QDT00912.1 hypothetical protein HG15A2_42540 [Adhaeretor mobilis]
MRYAPYERLLPLAIVCAASMGCGDCEPISYVKGKVSCGGKPVPADTRVFFEQAGKGYLAARVVQEDGTYVLKHKRAEEYRPGEFVIYVGPPTTYLTEVEFRALKKKVNADFRSRVEKPLPSPDGVLPVKYYQSSTSPLRETVKQGDNVINFLLED